MMFVPTDIYCGVSVYMDNSHIKCVKKLGTMQKGLLTVFKYENGELGYCQSKGWNRGRYGKPITLTCPYCSATLQQSERVECECGWVGIAQPEEFLDAFDWGAYNDDLVGLMTNGIGAPYPMDENTLCRRINKIWWLEIERGDSE